MGVNEFIRNDMQNPTKMTGATAGSIRRVNVGFLPNGGEFDRLAWSTSDALG